MVFLAICYNELTPISWIWPKQESPRGCKGTYPCIRIDLTLFSTLLPILLEEYAKICKFCKQSKNDLHDLDLDFVTFRIKLRYVDLDYSYLWCNYGDDLRSLRLLSAYIKLWPLTSIIWPWRQNFKILLQQIYLLVIKNISVLLQLLSIKTVGEVKVWPWTL